MGNLVVKGVVASVRNYLEAIGHPISSAQGHQVVALALGLKGKEVLAAKFTDVKRTESRDTSAVGVASKDCEVSECRTAATTSNENALSKTCQRCDSTIADGFCSDLTCMYSDWPQSVPVHVITTKNSRDIENLYSVKKRAESYSPDLEFEKNEFMLAGRAKVQSTIAAIERDASRKMDHEFIDEFADYMSSEDMEKEVCEKLYKEFKTNPDLVFGDWKHNWWLVKSMVRSFTRSYLARVRPDFFALHEDIL